MPPGARVVGALVVVTLAGHISCNNYVGNVSGVLTPNCARNYYRIYVTRRVPPRNYQYFHETLTPEQLHSTDDDGLFEEDTVYRHAAIQWRILGGKPLSITKIPYQVLYGPYCGGTLIAPDWVLTAAHCKSKETFILAGSTKRSEAIRYPICAHYIHHLWAPQNSTKIHSHDFDYQLVLLEKAVPVTPFSRPIAIGNLDDVKVGELVSVSGWGHTKYKQRAMQDILRRVFVKIIPQEECQSLPLPNYKTITSRMFCAGDANGIKDSCQGDSGGPVVYKGKLIGLVSFGVGCGSAENPGVYSKIPAARDWIRQVTGLPL